MGSISKHLLELQREIKEEEDEIFADLNSLLNDRSNLYLSSSFEAEDEDDFEENGAICGGLIVSNSVNTINSSRVSASPPILTQSSLLTLHQQPPHLAPLPQDLTSFHQSHHSVHQSHHQTTQQPITPPRANRAALEANQSLSRRQGEFIGSEDNDYLDQRLQRLHHRYDHQVSSDQKGQQQHQQQLQSVDLQIDIEEERQQKAKHERELELEPVEDTAKQQPQQQQQQQQHEQSFQEAVQQQQRDIQELTSNLPKPCVFFLEGNCRRSDCKFSHDLSSIICKYWIEGFCFKGDMCPFSHNLESLNSNGNNGSSDSDLLDDEQRSHLSEKQLNPTFVIESEADFPSLPLDAPAALSNLLGDGIQLKSSKQGALTTKTIKNQILTSNPTLVFKTTKKKRKRG